MAFPRSIKYIVRRVTRTAPEVIKWMVRLQNLMARTKYFALPAVVLIFAGCVAPLPFQHRPSHAYITKAKILPAKNMEPISIRWEPELFPKSSSVQSPSGIAGTVSPVDIPTGIGLSSRIVELLDTVLEIDEKSKNILLIKVLNAESSYRYYKDSKSPYLPLTYSASCILDLEFNYKNMIWNETFISEKTASPGKVTTQTAVLEHVWDDIAFNVVKNIIEHINKHAN